MWGHFCCVRTFCLWWHFQYLTLGRNYRKIIFSHSFLFNSFARQELLDHFRTARSEKHRLHQALREFEEHFYRQTGRWGTHTNTNTNNTHRTTRLLGFFSFILSFNKLGTFGFQQCLVKNKEKNIHKRKSIVMVRPCNAHPLNVNTAQRAQERDEEIDRFFLLWTVHILSTVHVSPPK